MIQTFFLNTRDAMMFKIILLSHDPLDHMTLLNHKYLIHQVDKNSGSKVKVEIISQYCVHRYQDRCKTREITMATSEITQAITETIFYPQTTVLSSITV